MVHTLDSDLAFANSFVGEAVRLALYVRAQMEAVAQSGGTVDGSGRADATIRRIESLVRGKNLGPAMRQLDLLQDIVNGEGNRAAVISIPEFRDILSAMSVEATEMDRLTEEQLQSVERSSAVQISEATMLEVL